MDQRTVSGEGGLVPLSSIAVLRERRRRALESGPQLDTRETILAAMERVLGELSLHEVTVAQILEEARVSRKAFYSYFVSKHEAAGALLATVMDEMYLRWLPFVELRVQADPLTLLRGVLAEAYQMWDQHAAIATAVHEYWRSVPELGTQWLAAMERFTAGVALAIDTARAAGLLPSGADSRTIAAAGLWTCENMVYVMRSGQSTDLRDLDAVLDTTMQMWAGLLYGPLPHESP